MAPAGIRDLRASWASLEGLSFPLGVTWIAEEEAWNFAIYSEHADGVTVVLYADDPAIAVLSRRLDYLRNKSGPVWHCRILATAMKDARFYGYQVEGAHSEKIFFNPYARALHFPPGLTAEPRSVQGRTPAVHPSG